MSLCAIFDRTAAEMPVSRLLFVIAAVSGRLLAHTQPLSLLWLSIAAVSAILSFGIKTFIRILAVRGFQLAVHAVDLSACQAFCPVVGAVRQQF
ncbi:hypothetical protein [Arthrobacter nitrophenolicus]|uniref:Uncharacterized protein n=1 Tax=Arthrobacter nitrophenolicus TaxID=683150 RepID=A0A4R5YA57_9MICC|nr:hypothetical protein [Arthrobacter nitrophenolicus]TDL41574.1 hypothetical protein E2R57_02650 [Arthrobacter nitrophenolicus]